MKKRNHCGFTAFKFRNYTKDSFLKTKGMKIFSALIFAFVAIACVATSIHDVHGFFSPSVSDGVIMGAFTTGLCPQIQQSLVSAFGANAPAQKRRRLGFLEFLASEYNRSGFQVIQLDGGRPGKIRTVQLVYEDPYCNDVAEGSYDCLTPYTTNLEPDPKEVLVTLPANPFIIKNAGAPKRLKLTDWEIRKLCQDKDQFVARQILMWLFNFEEGFDLALLGLAAPLIGTFADGTAEKAIPLYVNGTDGISAPLKSAQHKLRNEYADIRAYGVPVIIGDNLFQNYNSDVNRGACCNLNGVNMVPSDGWYFFEDDQIESVLGDGRLLQVAPGALQLVTWHKYAAQGEPEDFAALERGQIISPWTGMEYDFKIFYDVNCEAYFLEIFSYSKLVASPAGGCGLPTSNGVLEWRACAEEEVFECPAEVS